MNGMIDVLIVVALVLLIITITLNFFAIRTIEKIIKEMRKDNA